MQPNTINRPPTRPTRPSTRHHQKTKLPQRRLPFTTTPLYKPKIRDQTTSHPPSRQSHKTSLHLPHHRLPTRVLPRQYDNTILSITLLPRPSIPTNSKTIRHKLRRQPPRQNHTTSTKSRQPRRRHNNQTSQLYLNNSLPPNLPKSSKHQPVTVPRRRPQLDLH